jgi:hypothetical protein
MRAQGVLVLALVVAFSCAPVLGQPPATNSTIAPAILRDGTALHLTLARTVSSESDQAGELVEFIVNENLVAGTTVVLAEGSSVFGKVVASRLDDRGTQTGGMIEFRLESVRLANGQEIPLRTIAELPTNPDADLKPEKLTNLVNSPYAPFAHFNNGYITTVPKSVQLTLYVAADVNVGLQPIAANPLAAYQVDSVASHITNSNIAANSLGEIARQQRERGKIGGGMVNGTVVTVNGR